jgi:regulator of sigma E protease
MDFILSAIAFIIIFSVIILIHEYGHFWAARRAGIKVEEFGIGLPPRIWGKKKGGIIWSVNWIPFGGFVRLYGEDSSDPKILKDPKSFASKPLRKRMLVAVAGVLMNFILAILLLTIGFSIGIEPLLVNSEDVFGAINDRTIEIANGTIVKSVEEGSISYEAGLRDEDIIVGINGEDIFDPYSQLKILEETPTEENIFLVINRNGETMDIRIDSSRDLQSFGVEMYGYINIPRLAIGEIKPDSEAVSAGLMQGDVIIKMNNNQIYSINDYQTIVNNENVIEFEIFRDNQDIIKTVEFNQDARVVVGSIVPDSPAFEAGLKSEDIIISINGEKISTPQQAVDISSNNIGKEVTYNIKRGEETIELKAVPGEDGRVGFGITTMASYKNNQLSLFGVQVPTSIKKINDIKLPIHKAFIQSFHETGRLAVLTVGMVGDLVKSLTSKFAVPDGVSGPVGIATMTHLFVQQGLLALLRFTALLSLSLGVINIIPFPALDGGRLLFLLLEGIRGKRIPAKWETLINATGFFLLLGLILFVTYSDILNIFS